jgi:probable HAF family extracellular repeat protein
MNVNYQTSKPVRAFLLLTLSLLVTHLRAQTVTITPIIAPGTPFSATALNGSGQVAGYFFDSEFAQRAFLWYNGTAVDLGTLGGSMSVGNALNNSGQVAGSAALAGDGEFHAFASSGNNLSDLGTLGGSFSSASAINDAGTVVGQSDTGSGYRAFRRLSGGMMQSIGTLGGSYSSANRINNVDQIVGGAAVADDAAEHAFLYTGGAMLDLGTLGGTSSLAVALNESGYVTGESGTASGETHAFLYDGTTLLDLGTLGGTVSRGLDINNAGQVIGNSTISGDLDFHGFIYGNGALQDLGTLGGTGSTARDINNRGQVVGTSSDNNSSQRAFLWENGILTDLNTFLPANSGWQLTDARLINDNGQIVGEGLYQGEFASFLLSLGTDENEPPVANAGPDQTFACGVSEAHITLDGSGSSDPDGGALTFEWLAGGVSIGTGVSLSLTLSAGSYLFTLRVTDSDGAITEDSVAVVVGLDAIPPVVECPSVRTVPANEEGRARIPNLLESLIASDNCTAASALVKEQKPAAGTAVRCGNHVVTLIVVDAAGNRTICSATVTVADVTPPVVKCPGEIFRRARTNCQAAVPALTPRLRVHDNCTSRKELAITQDPAPGTLVGVGNHEVRFTVADAAGNKATCSTTLHVVDWSRPVFSSLTASPDVLRPANGQMVPVTLTAQVKDNCDPNPVSRIVAVVNSERADDTPDWRITGDMSLQLRAEVASRRGPRVYTILVACTDASGNTALRSAHVKVPRN